MTRSVRSVIVTISVVELLLLMALGAVAQPRGFEIRSPDHPEGTRPGAPVRDLYPSRTTVPDTPGFVAPFSKRTETGQAGVAGWTAPNLPVGSRVAADPENPGWLGLGFAAQWGGPAGRVRN
jgi:hypothetical protein